MDKKSDELITAIKELAFQYEEKEKRAAELVGANKELVFQNGEKEMRAAELVVANKELVFQNGEKEMRAAELVVANKELLFQNGEKEMRAAELVVANKELVFQNGEKEMRAAELVVANKELVFQFSEKEKRAAELVIANKELVFQNGEKEMRAAELTTANLDYVFQNGEKEKRAAELVIANKELAFQNEEKEKRAAELIIANKELAFQNEEKEKRAAELIIINNELLAFTYVASHDLQEPLRKIHIFSKILLEKESHKLSPEGLDYFHRIQVASSRMQQLIDDLLTYSRTNATERKFELKQISDIIDEAKTDLNESIEEKNAIIETSGQCQVNVIPFQFQQLMSNLINNALKFSKPGIPPHIVIKSKIVKGSKLINRNLLPGKEYCHISVKDNGIGFDSQYKDRIFEVFQRLHGHDEYKGTGIGLSIVKKIVDNHHGVITASGELDKGATFDIFIPSTPDSGDI